MADVTNINYYDSSVTVNGKYSRLSYFFVDYLTDHARVMKDGTNWYYTEDEATDIAYAIANRSEGSAYTYYQNFKAIMDLMSPTYVATSGKGAKLKKEIEKLRTEANEKDEKIEEYQSGITELTVANNKLNDKLNSETNETGDEVTYRQEKKKISDEIAKNNKQIEKLEKKIEDLREETISLKSEISEKQEEYNEIAKELDDPEYEAEVDEIELKIQNAEVDYNSAITDREVAEEEMSELWDAYKELVDEYNVMVTSNKDSQGNAVTRSDIKKQAKETKKAEKAYYNKKEEVDELVEEEKEKKEIWEGYNEELDELIAEREDEETVNDVDLAAALSYFGNYKEHQEMQSDGTRLSLTENVFAGNDSTDAEIYVEGYDYLNCRGQDLGFYYSGCSKEAGFVETGTTHLNDYVWFLNFWKLYDEQLTLKAVYDYCAEEERLGKDVDTYIDMTTNLLFTSDFYKQIKACVSMINEMTNSPVSFYDKQLSSDEITAYKDILESIGYINHYYQYANNSYYYADEEKAKYDDHLQIVNKIKTDTAAELETIRGTSIDCVDKMTEKLDEILENFYIVLQEEIRMEKEGGNDENNTEVTNESAETVVVEEKTVVTYTNDYNTLGRYETEAEYFQKLKNDDPIAFNKIVDKFKYFQPAYHSMSPEGFNARLTFIQQCTRQGHTLEDKAGNGMAATAGNLAFGRMPICVLKIGDFINTRIIINNVSISYGDGGMQWDLNSEGAGVQPMFAKINMSISILGGQSLDGPVSRLQNAVSFNYYANTGVYDNRADRITIVKDGGKDDNPLYATKYNYIFNPMENNSK